MVHNDRGIALHFDSVFALVIEQCYITRSNKIEQCYNLN